MNRSKACMVSHITAAEMVYMVRYVTYGIPERLSIVRFHSLI